MAGRNNTAQWRRGLIAKVKIGQKALGMSDEEYRGMLLDLFGVESCTKLDIRQLEDLVAHLASRGVDYPDSGKRYPRKDPAKFYEIPENTNHARQKRYIAALWHALGWKMSGLNVRARLQFDTDSFLWINDQRHLQTLTRDLVSRCRKKGIDPRPEQFGI